MNKTPPKLWEKTHEVIQKIIPENSFELWIKPAKAVSISENKFIIEVPNKFFIDWFRGKHQEKIEKEIAGLLGCDDT